MLIWASVFSPPGSMITGRLFIFSEKRTSATIHSLFRKNEIYMSFYVAFPRM
nr:unnamed protein product [Callosobruchus analis]